ncbi:MAG: hypothetical protein AAF560_17395 [Acidobacteriota bacterium]
MRAFPGSFSVLTLACALLAVPVVANPVGQDFQINELTTDDQTRPDVAAIASDHFLVVWGSSVSPGDDTEGPTLVGRRFDRDGNPVSGDFQLNTATAETQVLPRLSSSPDGSFVAQWRSPRFDGGQTIDTLQAQAFNSAGQPTADAFQVSMVMEEFTSFLNHDVALRGGVAEGAGELVVAAADFYVHQGVTGSTTSMGRFTVGGTTQDSRILDDTVGFGRVAVDQSDSGFVVVWQQANQTQALRYASDGSQLGDAIDLQGEIDVGTGASVDVAYDAASGDFITVWGANESVAEEHIRIYTRRVDAAGLPDPGGPVAINTDAAATNDSAQIARDVDGSWFAVWRTNSSAEDPTQGIRGRRLAADGRPVGEEMQINTYTPFSQWSPRIAAMPNGEGFLVVWQSEGGDGSGAGVRGRRVASAQIFVDSFESGDLSGWN